jgi:hypothetical protein
MAKIEDFGLHLSGAAKERWRGYRDALSRARREVGDPLTAPLSEAFPEPPYARLVADGADPWMIAFVRAAREQVPARPRDPRRAAVWAMTVRVLRDFASDLIDGALDRDRLAARLEAPAYARLRDGLEGQMALYLALGHDRSLRGHRITKNAYRSRDGERFDPPQVRWDIVREKGSRTLISELTREGAIAAFRDRIAAEADRPVTRQTQIEIYTWRGKPERGAVIAVKNGQHLIELARFPTSKAAQFHLRENRELLEARLAELRALPPERGEENRERTGPARRDRDVPPGAFLEIFGFRGVQFGNYVEGTRRQADLNRAHDALIDLADIIGCEPGALSLGGTLGLAFGARGRGGKGAAAAHYEPDQVVINLTKTNGAGSLAHEWFHALDNHLARSAGARTSQYFTEMDGPGAALTLRLANGTGLLARSRQLDRVRSSPYFSTRIEMAARAFEGFVISQLGEREVVNDYLANVLPQAAFEAVAEMRGQPPGGYPYPLAEERVAVRDAFERFLSSPAVRGVLGPAGPPDPVIAEPPAPDPPNPSVSTRVAETGQMPETKGPEQSPGPSDTPDFEWC